jgi:cytochrome c553
VGQGDDTGIQSSDILSDDGSHDPRRDERRKQFGTARERIDCDQLLVPAMVLNLWNLLRALQKGKLDMKLIWAMAIFAVLGATQPVVADGDAEAGREKANSCMLCHGSKDFGGMFYQLQLAGRNTDKLATKINKYRTGKLFHPMMSIWVMGLSEKDAVDIAAYYESLGKPAIWVPGIKGDDDGAQ